jgi:hypothetical protein
MWKAPIDLSDELLAAAKLRYLQEAGEGVSGRSGSFSQVFKAAVEAELDTVWELLLQAGLGRTHRPAGSDSKRSQRTIDPETYERVQQAYLETDVNELMVELSRSETEIALADVGLGELEASARQTRREADREPDSGTLKTLLGELDDLKQQLSTARSQLKKTERKAMRCQAKLDKALDGFEEPVDISFNRIARCCLVRYAYPGVAEGNTAKK